MNTIEQLFVKFALMTEKNRLGLCMQYICKMIEKDWEVCGS
jgi:hypothetical protein